MPSLRRAIFIWFITCFLVTSCVPAFITPTPIGTLDPNAINLFIAETANAASLQTAAAMPTVTPPATITPTPRNTFTPEPTFSPVPEFVIPSATPAQRVQYYRLKHDHQLAMFDYRSRTIGEDWGFFAQTPEIVPMYLLPNTTSGTGRTIVDGGWETFIDMLNNSDQRKLSYLKSDATALFNTAGFPQMESLTMGGNIITLDEIQGEWGRVSTLDYASPPNAEDVNYVTRPDLVHKFVVVGWRRSSKTTILTKPPRGDIYYPLVSRRPVWVKMDRLEAFPILPMDVKIQTDVYLQPEPGPRIEETGVKLSAGDSARLIAYQPSGSNVWGRLQRGGWIPLLMFSQYTTSWRMETIPPP